MGSESADLQSGRMEDAQESRKSGWQTVCVWLFLFSPLFTTAMLIVFRPIGLAMFALVWCFVFYGFSIWMISVLASEGIRAFRRWRHRTPVETAPGRARSRHRPSRAHGASRLRMSARNASTGPGG
jgi:hypothetical protein